MLPVMPVKLRIEKKIDFDLFYSVTHNIKNSLCLLFSCFVAMLVVALNCFDQLISIRSPPIKREKK